MKKSLYSLMLMDDVVEKIDALATEKKTNRSNLVNQILAEYVSYTTPEKRIADIFGEVESLLDRAVFSPLFALKERTFFLKSSLDYKYRPTVKYEVELYRTNESTIGELKVSFRTQSAELLAVLTDFFRLWTKIEAKYVGRYFAEGALRYSLEAGKFYRTLNVPNGAVYTEQDIASAINGYVKLFDIAIKGYLNNGYSEAKIIERQYIDFLESGAGII